MNKQTEAMKLALIFHEAYERLAPRFGYETRPETRNFDPESKNGMLMLAVCLEIIEQPAQQEPVAYATKEDFCRELERRLKHIREEMKIKSVTMRCKDYDIALPIIDTDFGRVLVGQVSTSPQRNPLTDEEMADYLGDRYHSMTENELEFFRLGEAANGIKENT